MADGLRAGWEYDDRNDNTNIVRAKIPTKLLPGTGDPGASVDVLIKSNLSNGNYDVYRPGGFGTGSLGGDQLIYSINASNNKLIIRDQALFDARFNQNNAEGRQQFETLNKQIRLATFDNAQLLTGTDPIRNQNFERIKQAETYKSLANSTPAGQRAPGATGATGGTPTPAPGSDPDLTSTEAELNFQIKTKGVRTEYGNMIYPKDLVSQKQKQDVVKFTMVSYGTRKIEGLRLTRRESNKEKQINGSVVLGIQPRISDNNTVRWNEQGMDVLGIGAAGASLGIIKEGFEGGKKSIEQIGKAFQQEGSNVTGALKIFFAQQGATTQNLLSRLTGGILNPNIELLFESPELRTFNYNFQLSPREPKEAQEIKKIIRFFKQGMAVQRSEAELFLKAPNVFEIKYLLSNGKRNHPYLNQIKRCALVNCGVDYTPTGSYMTFAGAENSMVTYNLSLTFRELEPIYADDYETLVPGGNSDTHIGF